MRQIAILATRPFPPLFVLSAKDDSEAGDGLSIAGGRFT
jgi:hypothetical protein